MRYTTLFVASVLTLVALDASAQSAGKQPTVDQQQNADKRKRASTEPLNSPFTYEALGATPSFKKPSKAASEEKVAGKPAQGTDKDSPARSKEPASTKSSSGSSSTTEPRARL